MQEFSIEWIEPGLVVKIKKLKTRNPSSNTQIIILFTTLFTTFATILTQKYLLLFTPVPLLFFKFFKKIRPVPYILAIKNVGIYTFQPSFVPFKSFDNFIPSSRIHSINVAQQMPNCTFLCQFPYSIRLKLELDSLCWLFQTKNSSTELEKIIEVLNDLLF